MRWYYFYVPLHIAGSGGNRLIAKCQTTETEIRKHFPKAHIDGQAVYVNSRP